MACDLKNLEEKQTRMFLRMVCEYRPRPRPHTFVKEWSVNTDRERKPSSKNGW